MPSVVTMNRGNALQPVDIYLPLQTFMHQVGGHTSMHLLDDRHVCKPLIPRELCFYQDMPAALMEFTPQCKGVIAVAWASDDGICSPVAVRAFPFISCMDKSSQIHLPCGGEFDGDLYQLSSSVITPSHWPNSVELPTVSHSEDRICDYVSKNTGTTRQIMQQHSTLVDDSTSCQFLVLENLAYHLRMPCILDLKIGTRQHGDDATEAKRLGHTKKCMESTSSSLGLRVCGMQVYQEDTGEYIHQSRYYGRLLDCQGVRRTLRQFLYSGSRFLVELVEPVVARLRELVNVIKCQESYRFYSSSLLIMYDGDPRSVQPRHISVHMIDFAHSTYRGFLDDTRVHIGPHCGFLFGLQNLIDLFEEFHSLDPLQMSKQ